MSPFQIGDRLIGPGERPYIIAEVGQAHDGSLGVAMSYIELAAELGVDAVKFQTHYADEESDQSDSWRVKFSYEDATRYDYWKRMEFSLDEWVLLRDKAEGCGLDFLSTPFSVKAIETLMQVGVKCWKVGSAETTDPWLLNYLVETKLPIIASTGMSSFQEIDAAVSLVKAAGVPLSLLQCTSAYPCPPEKVGLNVLGELRERYEVPVGLSDHSGEVFAPLAAMALGADIIEAHIVFDRRMFGPDSIASLDPSQFALVCRAANEISIMRNSPIDKDELAGSSLTAVRHVFDRRLVAARDLPKGAALTSEHLTFKKAPSGISVKELGDVLGKDLMRDVNRGQLLSKTDFVSDE